MLKGKEVKPVPPFATVSVPLDILEALRAVIEVPEPEKLVDVKVFVVLFHVKFALYDIAVVPPINNLSAVKAVTPVPP